MDNDIFPMSAAKAAENSQQDTLDTDESDFDIDIDVDEMIPGVAETSAQTGRPLPVDGSSPGSSSLAERPKATTLEVFEASAGRLSKGKPRALALRRRRLHLRLTPQPARRLQRPPPRARAQVRRTLWHLRST
ncbi:unnamed protein product [Effrenium voratum]|nr:unnamed protein product [Effrenium voratum]